MQPSTPAIGVQEVCIPSGTAWLQGDLALLPAAGGVVLFVQGGGSGRHAPTLLVSDQHDHRAQAIDRLALEHLGTACKAAVVAGSVGSCASITATDSATDSVEKLAADWFARHLA